MAKTIPLRAPRSMKLHTMKEADIAAFVAKEAGRLLDAMPREVRPVGVNAVSIDAFAARTAADIGGWVQWTRACCDKRKLIEEFVDPVVGDFDPAAAAQRPALAGVHVESVLRREALSDPKMHPTRRPRPKP